MTTLSLLVALAQEDLFKIPQDVVILRYKEKRIMICNQKVPHWNLTIELNYRLDIYNTIENHLLYFVDVLAWMGMRTTSTKCKIAILEGIYQQGSNTISKSTTSTSTSTCEDKITINHWRGDPQWEINAIWQKIIRQYN
jgi:hypothetical protein